VLIVGKAGDSPCLGTKSGNVTSYDFQPGQTDIVSRGYICDTADGVYCDSKTQLCTALSPIGGPCTTSFGSQCVSGAYCDTTQDKCAAQIADGAACDSGIQNCVLSDWCDPTTKVCAARLAQGALCTDSRSCSSGNCVNGKCSASNDLGLAFVCGGN
jgi:hypothetical protein